MRKTSRLWWLHGAILLSAVIGCKSSNCNSGGGCGAPGGAAMPYGGTAAGPTVGGGPTYTSNSYPGSGGMTGMTAAPSGGQFSNSSNGFQAPMTSSSLGGR